MQNYYELCEHIRNKNQTPIGTELTREVLSHR